MVNSSPWWFLALVLSKKYVYSFDRFEHEMSCVWAMFSNMFGNGSNFENLVAFLVWWLDSTIQQRFVLMSPNEMRPSKFRCCVWSVSALDPAENPSKHWTTWENDSGDEQSRRLRIGLVERFWTKTSEHALLEWFRFKWSKVGILGVLFFLWNVNNLVDLFSRACLVVKECGRPCRKNRYFGGHVLLCGLYWFTSPLVTFCFDLMFSGDGEMTMDEFIEGILRCKGPARAMDQAIWDWLTVEIGTAGSARRGCRWDYGR